MGYVLCKLWFFLLEMTIAKDHYLSLQYLHTWSMELGEPEKKKNDKKANMKEGLGWMTKYKE